MKDTKKLFYLTLFVFLLFFNISNASEKPLVQKIEKPAFAYDMAIYKDDIFYGKKIKDRFYIMKKNIRINKVPEIIYSVKALSEDYNFLDFIEIDKKPYTLIHRGAGLMGSDMLLDLSKTPAKNVYISSYESFAKDGEGKYIHLPFSMGIADRLIYEKKEFNLEKGGEYIIDTKNFSKDFKFTNVKAMISKDEIVLLRKNKNSENPYDMVIFNLKSKEEYVAVKNISSITVSDRFIYYTVSGKNVNKFYSYDIKDRKIKFLFENKNLSKNISNIGDNLIFFSNGRIKNDRIYFYKEGRLAYNYIGDIRYIFNDSKNLAVMYMRDKKLYVKVFDEKLNQIEDIKLPHMEEGIYLSDGRMLVWSYIDQMAVIYDIKKEENTTVFESPKSEISDVNSLRINCTGGLCNIKK